ncbi:hypothetical protein SORDD17_00615 [Streptococcus oralis]|uniref:Uncharacterized protein n=1 Tax=Streptococcus oralis TaxID=1303 RepID=A0A139RN64_STROR|nr:hypothetical protein SORDD17_00615 [Streptococcus oralis]
MRIEIVNLSDFIESAKEVTKKAEELELAVQRLNEMELELKTKSADEKESIAPMIDSEKLITRYYQRTMNEENGK